MIPSKYVQKAIRICEEHVAKQLSKNYRLPRRAESPFESGYCPDLNNSLIAGQDEASYYQFLREVMRWKSKIVHININTKVFSSSSHSGMSRKGQLEAVLHIIGYMMLRYNSRLVFDLLYHEIEHKNFQECDQIDFYKGAVKAIPPSAPLPKGKKVDLYTFVGSDHAGSKQTKKYRTRSMIYINMSLFDLIQRNNLL